MTVPLRRGLFVVFEGIDGSGKTTLCDRVATELRQHGLSVTQVREQGRYRSAVTQSIRELGRDQKNLEMTASTELLLLLAREVQLFEEATRPALEHSDVVLADRFVYTAAVMAEHGRGLPDLRVRSIIHAVTGDLEPDLVVLVDVDPQLARARRRVAKLLGADNRPSSRKGLAGGGLQHRVRDGYRAMAARDPERWVVVDNSEASLPLMQSAIVAGLLAAHRDGLAQGRHLLGERLNPSALGASASARASARSLEEGRQRFLDWIDRRMVSEPDLAAYHLAGLSGPGIDQRRVALATRSPAVIAHGLRGLADELAWRLRDALAEVAPAEVASSLLELPADDADAMAMRRRLAAQAPAAVALSLLHCDDASAWTVREQLHDGAALEVLASLGGLSSPRAWSWRERFLMEHGGERALASYQLADAICRSLAGLDEPRAFALRERASAVAPVSAIASLTGSDSDAAHAWRTRYLRRAPRPVLKSLVGLEDEPSWTLREQCAEACKEAIGSLAGLDAPRAWQLRDRYRDLWPTAVAASLGPTLAHTAPGAELLGYLLRQHPSVSVWRSAAAALPAHAARLPHHTSATTSALAP